MTKKTKNIAKPYKGKVILEFKTSKKTYKVGDILETESKAGLDNLISNGFLQSNVDLIKESNKKIEKWQR